MFFISNIFSYRVQIPLNKIKIKNDNWKDNLVRLKMVFVMALVRKL